jgi:hypothetical protein
LSTLLAIAALAQTSSPDGCSRATQHFDAASREVSAVLPAYQRCVAASGARDDCTVEFGDLDMAQDRFEAAVREYAEACR